MRLTGGQTYRTRDTAKCAKVVNGELLVYILPYKEEIPGKKLFLCTVSEGETVPFLDLQIEEVQWNFQLVALEQAEIEIVVAEASLEEIQKILPDV